MKFFVFGLLVMVNSRFWPLGRFTVEIKSQVDCSTAFLYS
jgi:hypothetical protein